MFKRVKSVLIRVINFVLTIAVVVGFLAYKPVVIQFADDPIGQFLKFELGAEVEIPHRFKYRSVYKVRKSKRPCDNELTWLACAVYFEARGESEAGQYWLAQSIINRVASHKWPNTVEGVVRQGENHPERKCQYSFMCDGKPEYVEDDKAWEKAFVIALEAVEDFFRHKSKVTCAHSFRADYVTNKAALAWFATLETDDQIGAHIFYCG